jgi:hypothetical protein
MKKIKKLAILLMVVCMMLTFLSVDIGQAAGKKDIPSAPTEGTPSKNLRHGKGVTETELSTQATQYLRRGESSIKSISGTIVTVSGTTLAYSSVDTIAVDLYLQRWDANQGKWVDVLNVEEFKRYYESSVSGSKDVNIVRGYYYRTRAHHWTNEGGTVEQVQSVSSYIYVD